MIAGRDLRALPKTDLHVHLEGAMRASTVVELAERYGVDLPECLRDGRYEFQDFRHFIDEWLASIACLRSPGDFRRIALEFCQDEAVEGVRYAEVSLSLADHADRFTDWDAVVEGGL
jgi:adenosine deaminase